MSARLSPGVWLGLALIAIPSLALLAVESYVAIATAPQLSRNREQVAHTFDVITTAQGLHRALQDAERGQRGFLLTAEPAHLASYNKAQDDIPALLAQFSQLAGENPEDKRRAAQLERQVSIKLAELKGSLGVLDAQGIEAARAYVRSNVGLDAMESVTALIDGAIAGQSFALTDQLARSAADERRITVLTEIGVGLALAVMALGLVLGWLSLRKILGADRALEQARAELAQSQKMEALGQLSGGVAHDFNNVLQVINNAVAILQRKAQGGDAEMQRFLDMIRRNAERASSLTQRLLAFSRTQPLDPKPSDPNAVVAGMADLLRQTLGEKIAIQSMLEPGVWPIYVDTNHLETAIVNLAVNARDAMPEGGVLAIATGNTTLDGRFTQRHPDVAPGDYATIIVRDGGIGMSDEVRAKAFDPFFTTKAAGQGTGLGLSQVFGFIKQSNGHVAIASVARQGTTVTLYLPRYSDDSGIDSKEPAASEP